MLRRAGAAALVLSILGALAVLGAGPASGAPQLQLSPANGPAGSTTTVTGTGFAAADVELHWSTQSGPLLATATGPDFSVPVVVPDATPNAYPVVAVVRAANGASTSSASFQVTPGPASVATIEPGTAVPRGRTAVTAPDRNSGVEGGLDPAMIATADAVGQSPSPAAASPAFAPTSVQTSVAGGSSAGPSTTSTPAAVAGALDPTPPTAAGAVAGTATARAGADADAGIAGRALGSTSSSRPTKGARWPGLLLIGLGLGLAGAALVGIRTGATGAADGHHS